MTNKNMPAKETSDILDDTALSILEGLTGIAASKKEALILSAGYIFQGLRKGQFLNILLKEWKNYKEKGRIKDDYQYTEQHKTCLQELLDFLDKNLPDEIAFSFLKKIFLVAATESISDRESILPQQYLRICRNLSSGAILVLIRTYKIAKEQKSGLHQLGSARIWLKELAHETALNYPN